METPELNIPHPRIEERAFVLIPLSQIDSALLHPISGKRISDLVAEVQGKDGVKKIGELEWHKS